MITISGTVLVNRPRRAVFDFVGDYRNDPKWHTGIQEMRIDPPDEIRVVVRTQDFNRRMRRDLDRLKTIIESAEP